MQLYNWFCIFTTICSARVSVQSGIVFRDDVTPDAPAATTTAAPAYPQGLPLDLAKRLSAVTDEEDLWNNFISDDSKPPLIVAARFGASVERKAVKTAKMANCIPENQTVSLVPDNLGPATFFHPECTRVARCGGCCMHELLTCQPVEVEILQYSVLVTEFQGGRGLVYKGREVVSVEQHKQCKCDCKIKETDCNPYQKYNKDACRCECNNRDKQEKCKEESATKLWNSSECACMCRENLDCPSGFYYDRFTCECIKETPRRRVTSGFDRYNYNLN